MSPRLRKLVQDVWLERGRFGAMVGAIAASLVALGAVLGAWAVLTRELGRNYLDTHPADATIELGGDVDAAWLAQTRADPSVEVAEAGEVLRARLQTPSGWRPALVFVSDDPRSAALAIQRPQLGADPLPEGGAAMERTAADLFDLGLDSRLRLRFGDGASVDLPVTTIVHDPGLAPAWQEGTAYVYVSRGTLAAALGRPVALHDVRIRFAERSSTEDVDRLARALATELDARGATVHAVRVPPFERHPHQRQMTTVLLVLVSFAALSLVLAALVVASSLAALLARQVREIGVMKTLGATFGQLVALYAALVAAAGVAAVTVALPLGLLGGSVLASAVSRLLNFELASTVAPLWVPLAVALAGTAVPLLLSAVPIVRAARATVREALDSHGVSPVALRPWMARWPRPLRAIGRRPARLALTLSLLGAAGAMFVTAQNVSAGWTANLDKIAATRFDDVEIRFAGDVAPSVLAPVSRVPGVRVIERWDVAGAAFATGTTVDIARTWPDRGHGSLSVIGIPPDTSLVAFPMVAGRWLSPDDTRAAVLNQGALAQQPGLSVGDEVTVSIDGVPQTWPIVGVVEEIGSPGAVYVPRSTFDGPGKGAMLRVAGGDPAAVEAALDAAPIGLVMPRGELERAVGGHIALLVQSLTGMALVMAAVGGAGLASTAAVQVLERTREIAVEKTLGATPMQITGRFLAEAAWTSTLSVVLAWMLAVPLTLAMDALIGQLGFLAPLPFVFDPLAALEWALLAAVLTVLATASPALRAGEMTVREALAST